MIRNALRDTCSRTMYCTVLVGVKWDKPTNWEAPTSIYYQGSTSMVTFVYIHMSYKKPGAPLVAIGEVHVPGTRACTYILIVTGRCCYEVGAAYNVLAVLTKIQREKRRT